MKPEMQAAFHDIPGFYTLSGQGDTRFTEGSLISFQGQAAAVSQEIIPPVMPPPAHKIKAVTRFTPFPFSVRYTPRVISIKSPK